MTRTLIGLVGLALALGALAALLAQRVLTRPVATLTSDLGRIERFELEEIAYRPGRLEEFDKLSAALARMAKGLADFGKFIPTDLVRTLLADGVRATPGGDTREMTILFADVAGFTKMSERMGTAVIDVVSRYFDVASREVEAHGGAVDKFIGDAVMALWGAPRPDRDQAANACRAALRMQESAAAAGIKDDLGAPLRIRTGINSGPAVVGNIGSERRLNYTAIGDTVNLASRLEGVNKLFGTSILISESTRAAAGDAVVTRELAEIAVAGKAESIRVHELLGMADAYATPDRAKTYGTALAAYRRRDFAQSIGILERLIADHAGDGPAGWLLAECKALIARPPPPDWRGVIILDSK
jgi:adenylate cyclase